MKYTQYSQKKKGNSAFYITIALCLVLIGAAAWFAFTGVDNNKINNTSSKTSKPPIKSNEYNSSTESYNDNKEQVSPEPTDEEVKNQEYSSTPKPTKKPKAYSMPVNGDILKDFNLKALQYSSTYNDMRIHAAVDIAVLEGTIVSAVTDGKILAIENTADLGKTVTIDHGDGLIIKYCGLKNITVEKDKPIKMGENIGAVGSIPSECSDQSHLHVEAFESGKSVSVLKYFE